MKSRWSPNSCHPAKPGSWTAITNATATSTSGRMKTYSLSAASKPAAIKTCLETYAVPEGGPVFYDALMRLGAPRASQTQRPVRVVGYWVDSKQFWVATNRFDLPAADIALIYKLRWEIEKFFGWWKQHLNVYPLIARSPYGFMVQVLGGLITYLLLAIYCHKHFQEKVSINRVRELRINIQNEARILDNYPHDPWQQKNYAHAKT